MKNQYESIIEVLQKVKGNTIWTLHQPIIIRLSPHAYPYEIHGLQVSPNGKLYITDIDGDWAELTLEDQHADKIIASIFQRVRYVFASQLRTENEVNHV